MYDPFGMGLLKMLEKSVLRLLGLSVPRMIAFFVWTAESPAGVHGQGRDAGRVRRAIEVPLKSA